MPREKTIVVVFPPFNTPTLPPLGAAMLKGFVERQLPDWRVLTAVKEDMVLANDMETQQRG